MVKLFMPQPFVRTGPDLANEGQPRFDLSVWKDASFARLLERLEQAGRRGIYASVMLFEARTIKFGQECS